ncbi:MAG: SGNH/GDSL hydrolase family protein [Pseudomonadota bacterium]
MNDRKKKIFWAILAVLFLFCADIMAGIYNFIAVTPLEMKMGLPSGVGTHFAHPYKSYSYRTDGQGRYWVAGEKSMLYSLDGVEYDFGMIQGGIAFDQFGHGVLPDDLKISDEKKKQGEYRILFLGGSTTFQPWPYLVGDLLKRQTSKNIRVINAGTGGYTSQENIADLVTSGFVYQPDMIVAYLPINDIYHASRWPNFKRDYTHFRTALRFEMRNSTLTQPSFAAIWPWPFGVKLFQTLDYNKRMDAFIKNASLQEFTTVTPNADDLGIRIDENSYKGTVLAVIDNIRSMKALAESRGIKFVLVTQRVFQTKTDFYTFIDKYVLDCIEKIKGAPELQGMQIVEMQKLFPDRFDDTATARVRADFPNEQMRFDQPMAYDSMHFSPASLYLFSSILAEKLRPEVR